MEEYRQQAEPLRKAGYELGTVLAKRGHTIVVMGDHDDDIDPYLVKGFIGGRKQLPDPVKVSVPKHDRKPPYTADEFKGLVKVVPHASEDWDITILDTVYEVDAVIAIGGRSGVIQTGLFALNSGKTLVPVGSFKGGGGKLWEISSGRRESFYQQTLNDEEINDLNAVWYHNAERQGGDNQRKSSAELVVQYLEKVYEAKQRAKTTGKTLGKLFRTVIGALAIWIVGLVIPTIQFGEPLKTIVDESSFLIMLLTLIAAGALGASLNSIRALRDRQPLDSRQISFDLLLGLVAGVVAALFYLFVQASTNGKIEVKFAEETDYVRVTLIGSLVALFSGLYLDATLSRFDTIKDSFLPGRQQDEEG
ncbi:MAG TPA: hypothetical protein DCE41_02565 [Cytophagales bacterium]|nr:hypothetical protein [Cytophagales bacterium]